MPTHPLPLHSDPEVMGGTPVFVGTRVPAQTLVDYLEGGDSLDEFLADFPSSLVSSTARTSPTWDGKAATCSSSKTFRKPESSS